MKPSLFITTLCLFFTATQAQFSGKIVYQIEYQSHSQDSIEEWLTEPKVDSIHYLIAGQSYKSLSFSNGKLVEEYVYDPNSKKMLFSMGNRPYYLYLQSDLAKFDLPLDLAIQIDKKIDILDYSAYATHNASTGEINYFSEELQIDPSEFSAHHFMQWNKLLAETQGSLPLKTITRHQGYTETKTAVRVIEMKPEEMDFSFDSDRMQVAAYDNLDEVIDLPEIKGAARWCYQSIVESKSNQLIDGKDYQLILRFVLHPNAEISHVEIEDSEYEYLNEAAIKIIKTCDLDFEVGLINGQPVASELYYPINF